MGRNTNDKKPAKLSIKKETLRKLQDRTLSDDQLRGIAGGMSATCTDGGVAPSCRGC
jgi:hypothetical protein